MSVTSYTSTSYDIVCDECGEGEVCPDSNAEGVHSKQEAIKWARMHKLKDGKVLCSECFKKHKNGELI